MFLIDCAADTEWLFSSPPVTKRRPMLQYLLTNTGSNYRPITDVRVRAPPFATALTWALSRRSRQTRPAVLLPAVAF